MGAKKDTRDLIVAYLKSEQRTIGWLATQTEIPYPTLYFVLSRKERTLTDQTKEKINSILKTNF